LRYLGQLRRCSSRRLDLSAKSAKDRHIPVNGQSSLATGGLKGAALYAAFFLLLIGYLNYVEPYSPDPVSSPVFWQIVLWTLLYLPVFVLPLARRWQVREFGFTLGPSLYLVAFVVALLCGWATASVSTTWTAGVLEAYARTGEELFFRGFLFTLLMRVFGRHERPWLWAAVGSSLLFALAHTQTFQTTFFGPVESPLLHAFYIAQRLLNVFGIAFVFALLRVWTGSILPGAIAHSVLSSNILALPFVLIIYFWLAFWAYWRGEAVAAPRLGARWGLLDNDVESAR
jgi:uncharacterized protein